MINLIIAKTSIFIYNYRFLVPFILFSINLFFSSVDCAPQDWKYITPFAALNEQINLIPEIEHKNYENFIFELNTVIDLQKQGIDLTVVGQLQESFLQLQQIQLESTYLTNPAALTKTELPVTLSDIESTSNVKPAEYSESVIAQCGSEPKKSSSDSEALDLSPGNPNLFRPDFTKINQNIEYIEKYAIDFMENAFNKNHVKRDLTPQELVDLVTSYRRASQNSSIGDFPKEQLDGLLLYLFEKYRISVTKSPSSYISVIKGVGSFFSGPSPEKNQLRNQLCSVIGIILRGGK